MIRNLQKIKVDLNKTKTEWDLFKILRNTKTT